MDTKKRPETECKIPEEAERMTNPKKPEETKTQTILVPEKMETKQRPETPEQMEMECKIPEEAERMTNSKKPEETITQTILVLETKKRPESPGRMKMECKILEEAGRLIESKTDTFLVPETKTQTMLVPKTKKRPEKPEEEKKPQMDMIQQKLRMLFNAIGGASSNGSNNTVKEGIASGSGQNAEQMPISASSSNFDPNSSRGSSNAKRHNDAEAVSASQNQDDPPVPANCFSADTLVRTVYGEKRMDQLEVGDLVLVPASAGTLKYERVELFYHIEPDTQARFLQIVTESGKTLSLTALHMLPFGNCSEMRETNLDIEGIEQWMRKSRFVHKASVGDCVFTLDDRQNEPTVRVERIQKVGLDWDS
uniref:Hint domain-containing protein n=1 Tax=Globodera rostochiensis TaxID=31243 RepID=A0A914HFX5_GLORO